jgi:hypothetical protein
MGQVIAGGVKSLEDPRLMETYSAAKVLLDIHAAHPIMSAALASELGELGKVAGEEITARARLTLPAEDQRTPVTA